MPQVSVIVPVYNAEKYLDRCINSILSQTYQDFELILVDDGSKDQSGVICDGYAQKDGRVRVIHQANGGVSAARNKGMKNAAGRFLMFCDADDYVAPTWIERLLGQILQDEDSYVACNYYTPNATQTLEFKKISFMEFYLTHNSAGVSNKIFRMDIIKEHDILFDLDIPIAEDVLYNAKYLCYCNGHYYYTNEQLYFYETNLDSATHKYYPKMMEYSLNAFYARIPFLDDVDIAPYCDQCLYMFIHGFDNVFDRRNNWSFFQKMQYNQRMLNSKEFAYCLSHATGQKENPKLLALLRTGNYYLYWTMLRIADLKKKIFE